MNHAVRDAEQKRIPKHDPVFHRSLIDSSSGSKPPGVTQQVNNDTAKTADGPLIFPLANTSRYPRDGLPVNGLVARSRKPQNIGSTSIKSCIYGMNTIFNIRYA